MLLIELPCGSGFCQCQWELGASGKRSLETLAVAPLRACPVCIASASPQEAARPRIVNGILGFVTLIGVLGLLVMFYD